MQKWADNTKAVQDESIKLAIITQIITILALGLRLRIYLCWGCQKPSGKTRENNSRTKVSSA